MTPQQSETDERVRRGGLQLIGSSVVIGVMAVVIGFLVLQNTALTNALTGVSTGLTQQRDQFEACKDKPAKTRGCTTPVAAEPAVIIKQGQRGLTGLTGADGLNGRDGKDGRDGIDGKDGKPGKDGAPGKQGSPPGCALLSTACMGKDGRDGIDGKDGANGLDGAAGADGQDGKPGADGKAGADGKPGRGISNSLCTDEDNDPGTPRVWVIYWTAEPMQTVAGPCQ